MNCHHEEAIGRKLLKATSDRNRDWANNYSSTSPVLFKVDNASWVSSRPAKSQKKQLDRPFDMPSQIHLEPRK